MRLFEPLFVQDGIEFHIYHAEIPQYVRCFEGKDWVVIDLKTIQLVEWNDDCKGEFLRRALTIFGANYNYLLRKWKEINP